MGKAPKECQGWEPARNLTSSACRFRASEDVADEHIAMFRQIRYDLFASRVVRDTSQRLTLPECGFLASSAELLGSSAKLRKTGPVGSALGQSYANPGFPSPENLCSLHVGKEQLAIVKQMAAHAPLGEPEG